MKSKNWSLPKKFCRAVIDHGSKQYSLKEFLRQINLNKNKFKKIEALLHGSFESAHFGAGFDFNEIREYKIGDDLRHISWNATAKTGTLQTKEYLAEKEIRSYFLIDISNSMFCGNKFEPFIQLTAFLLNTACTFSEKIGGLFFSSKIKHQFPPGQASLQANIIFQTLIDLLDKDKEKIQAQGKTNISSALESSKQFFKKKGLLFIISDFVNLSNWEKMLYETVQKQNVYSFQIYDPIDFQIPNAGYITIIDPETNERFIVNTDSKKLQEAYKNTMNESQKKLEAFFKTIGVHHLVIEKSDFT